MAPLGLFADSIQVCCGVPNIVLLKTEDSLKQNNCVQCDNIFKISFFPDQCGWVYPRWMPTAHQNFCITLPLSWTGNRRYNENLLGQGKDKVFCWVFCETEIPTAYLLSRYFFGQEHKILLKVINWSWAGKVFIFVNLYFSMTK